jgi:hypothetical protein
MLSAQYPDVGCVFSSVAVAQQPFVNESSQQSETDGSFQTGSRHNLRQRKRLAVVFKQAKNGTSAGYSFQLVSLLNRFSPVRHNRNHYCIVPIYE